MRLAVGLLLLALPGTSSAQVGGENKGIFFGGVAGGGVAWIDHPDLSGQTRPGGYWALQFGWTLSPHLSAGGEFTAWGTSPLGTPVHLHTIGPRLELTVRPRTGAFAAGTVGLALTEGEVRARAGAALALMGGYRWAIGRWTTLAVEAGAHGHLYGNGGAAFPVAALQLRFHGGTDATP